MLTHFIKVMKEQDGVIKEFDESLWGGLVDCVEVYEKEKVVFKFKSGGEVVV